MLQALAVCAPPLEAWPQVALAKKQKQRLEFFLSEVAFRFCLCVSESQTVDFEIHGDLRNLHFKKWADIGKVVSGNLETNEQILHSHILMVGWNGGETLWNSQVAFDVLKLNVRVTPALVP